MSFFDKELLTPIIHTFSECPTCNELIPLNESILATIEKCPKCGVFIDMDELLHNFVTNFQTTQAISSANKISTFDIAVIIFVVIIVSYTFIFQLFSEEIFKSFFNYLRILNTLTFTTPLILTVRWYLQHGKLKSNDNDFLFAKKEAKKSLLLWIFAHVLNALSLFYLWKF
jgi:hypothetical protein